ETLVAGLKMSAPIATFSFPTFVIYGPGTLAALPDQLAKQRIKKPLVVTDPGLLPTRAFQGLKTVLEKGGLDWALFPDVHPNPIEGDVRKGAETFRRERCDGVVAFGGGSALDVGKAVRLL